MGQHPRGSAAPTRRRVVTTAVAAAAALVLAACGGDSGGDAEPAAESPAAAGAFPVSIEHDFGTATVEAAPTRVVSIGNTDHDVLLALGVVPVALQQWQPEFASGVGPWAQDELGAEKPEVFPSGSEVSVEKVAALRPDLIVAVSAGIDEGLYRQLAGVAPTIAKPKGAIDWGATLEQQTTMIARAVGKEAEGKALLADVEKKIADTAAEHPEFRGAASIVTMPWEDGSFYVYTTADPRIELLTKLGLTAPPSVTALGAEGFSVQVSAEKLKMLDDAKVVTAIDIGGTKAKFEADPIWKTLGVVQRGDVIWLNPAPEGSAFSHNTVLSIPYVLENYVPRLSEALKG